MLEFWRDPFERYCAVLLFHFIYTLPKLECVMEERYQLGAASKMMTVRDLDEFARHWLEI